MIIPPSPPVSVPPASTRLLPDFSGAFTRPPAIHDIPALRPTLPQTYSLPSLSSPSSHHLPHGTRSLAGDEEQPPPCAEAETHAHFLSRARRLLTQAGLHTNNKSKPDLHTSHATSPVARIHQQPLAALSNTVAIRFVWSRPAARSVFIAGNFNDWGLPAALTRRFLIKEHATTRHDQAVWETVLRLPVGTYFYKYVVDGEWQLDADTIAVDTPDHGKANKLIIDSVKPS